MRTYALTHIHTDVLFTEYICTYIRTWMHAVSYIALPSLFLDDIEVLFYEDEGYTPGMYPCIQIYIHTVHTVHRLYVYCTYSTYST